MEPAPRAKEDGGQKEETEAVVTAPQAPEDVTAPPPPPRKELLRPTSPTHLPGLLKNAPGKEGPPALAIQRSEADDLADPREWVQLDKRRLPEIEPPAELEPLPQEKTGDSGVELPMPAPGPQPAKEAKPKPEPIAEAVTEHNTGDAGPVEMLPPSGRTEATRPPVAEQKPEKETRPLPTAIEPPSTGSPPKEAISPSEGQPSPPKEVIPSPLDDAALESPAVREYLRQAAPILEELSVLMTTAPSLNLADYDPSDSPSPTVPKDIYLRMDAIKRQLQILDSKTFAIIPPPKYSAFHSLIRESIAETYQACTAIMGYLQENNAEDLRVIRDHLLRARMLIQRTRPRPNQG